MQGWTCMIKSSTINMSRLPTQLNPLRNFLPVTFIFTYSLRNVVKSYHSTCLDKSEIAATFPNTSNLGYRTALHTMERARNLYFIAHFNPD